MTSSDLRRRSARPCSPSAHRNASARLLLPDPFGPTTALMPGTELDERPLAERLETLQAQGQQARGRGHCKHHHRSGRRRQRFGAGYVQLRSRALAFIVLGAIGANSRLDLRPAPPAALRPATPALPGRRTPSMARGRPPNRLTRRSSRRVVAFRGSELGQFRGVVRAVRGDLRAVPEGFDAVGGSFGLRHAARVTLP